MKFKCPRCRYDYDLRAVLRERDLLEIIQMQCVFRDHSRLVIEYTELFDTTRPIKAARMLRILSEIRNVWVSGKFSYQKRTYQISPAGIVDALKVMCNKHFETPLQNHNYLKKVMIPIAEKEANERSKKAEKELLDKEERLMDKTGSFEPMEIKRVMPEDVKVFARKL